MEKKITDLEIIKIYGFIKQTVEMIPEISLTTDSNNKFTFSRINGRYLYDTESVQCAYAYVKGIAAYKADQLKP